jgi:hypothetical protein
VSIARWILPHSQVLGLTAAVLMASFASADAELPYVMFRDETPLSASCQQMLDVAASLLPQARACDTASDCDHYPCSCAAIAKNEEAQRYRRLVKSLQLNCGASIIYAYCGRTVPVCESGTCKVRRVLQRPE